MAKHEFGIMQNTPSKGQRYDRYEPEKFNCISVNDDYILSLLDDLKQLRCYWHTLDRPEMGLAYCGITIIPPDSLGRMMEIIKRERRLSRLYDLLAKAQREGKYIIHFGI